MGIALRIDERARRMLVPIIPITIIVVVIIAALTSRRSGPVAGERSAR